MRFVTLFAFVAAAAAEVNVQQVVDDLFDKYLPQKATWEEVKACRAKCGDDKECHASCPKYDCPFKRITAQCDLFNSTMTVSKECHKACDHHDFACHFKCPMAMPTSVKELQKIGESMLCHTRCGRDKTCHKSACPKPWSEKQERCDKLETVVSCRRNGGSHSTCPKLDNETTMQLLQEPQSFVKDIADHIVDYLLPLPAGQEATKEEVRACHMKCGHDFACHKACPTGAWGILKDQCTALDTAHTCHQTCRKLVTKCPAAKMKCHLKCPMSMPASVKELKYLTEHVACHTTCGEDKSCHHNCPKSMWSEKKVRCEAYNHMMACHRGCSHDRECHMTCPHPSDLSAFNEVSNEPNGLVKDLISVIV